MKRIVVLVLLLCVWQLPDALAGAGCSHSHAPKKRKRAAAKTTLADPAEDHYDIRHLLFHLNVTDTATHIDGNVATTAQVVATSMSEYVFELGPTMNIDSAKIDGAILPVVTTGSIRKISLPSALASGTVFTAQVWYHGTPPSGSGFFNGVTHATSSGGTHMVYTISDPWVALNWWPCKQSVLDQADSVNMFVTVPDGVVDGSNGVLVDVDNTTSPGYTTFHWQTHYPIDYYLISLAVARYAEYKSYWHFSGSSDSVLIQNFFLDTATFNPVSKINFDSIGHMVDYFSSLFGRYPFWQEKYGVCFTNLPGGMEHQTMTTIGVTNTTTIAHELTHQWFGDHVTYRTWGDMWLSEGFATFSEQLYLGRFWGVDAARDRRAAFIAQATGPTCGRTYVDDTTTSDSLFTVNQYQRAAMIINTLRYMAPEDSLFFKVLRDYQSAHSFGNAATSDFQAIAESVYGFSLDTFFNQWIYGRGYPRYRVSWNQVGSTVYVKLMQSQSCSSATAHFSTPVEVNLRAGSLDTFIRVYNSIDTQVFSIDWPETVSGVYLNTNAQTLLRQLGTSSHDTHLGFQVPGHGSIQVHPNPASDKWEISNLAIDTRLTLIDVKGRTLWHTVATSHSTLVPGQSLPTGSYFLRLENSEGVNHIKLTHW